MESNSRCVDRGDHDSTAFPSEAASRVWTRQHSPDDVTPVGRGVDFQQLKAAVLRAKLERDGVDDEEDGLRGFASCALNLRRNASVQHI